jgi:hypothetical protein
MKWWFYRFAVWLEYRAEDLQDFARSLQSPELSRIESDKDWERVLDSNPFLARFYRKEKS